MSDFFQTFFHYSGFDSGANEIVLNYYVPDKDNVIYKLRNKYIDEMYYHGQRELGNFKWTYSSYNSGKIISDDIRKEYRDKLFFEKIGVNPFSLDDEYLRLMMNPEMEKVECISFPRRVARKLIPHNVRKLILKLLGKK